MERKLLILLGTVFLVLATFLFLYIQFIQENTSLSLITVGDSKIYVEVADTPESRALGLSGRTTLEKDRGLLFVFSDEGLYGFWMKDMNFTIDIIWIDSERKIIGTTEDVSPETFPKTFFPPTPVKYVLEVNAGFSKIHNINQGNTAVFPSSF